MGTRGLLTLTAKGKRRVIYSPWDSMPTGMGIDLVKFILSLTDGDLEILIERLEKMKWHDDNDPSIEGLRAQYLQKGFATDWVPRSTSWITVFHNVLGAKALSHILDGSLDHMVDVDEGSEDIEWIYEVDLEEATLRTINSDGEEIGHRKFEDLTIEYMRGLELADESRLNHQCVVAAEVDGGRAGLQGLVLLTLMQKPSV